MTELERAIYLAMNAITNRYPNTCGLSWDEKQIYYRELCRRLQGIMSGGEDISTTDGIAADRYLQRKVDR